MNIEEFVSESLTQIIRGVQKAQENVTGTGARINPQMRFTRKEESIGEAEGYGGQPVSYVSFNVSVIASEGTGTKGGIGIVVGAIGLGSQGQSESSASNESRIQFKVPILMPTQNK